jgi:hypothetical protein
MVGFGDLDRQRPMRRLRVRPLRCSAPDVLAEIARIMPLD